MLATDDQTLRAKIRTLRNGPLTQDVAPYMVAEIIEQLMNERTALSLHNRDLQSLLTPRTKTGLANVYALGFRAALDAVVSSFPLDDLQEEIRALQPNFTLASGAARANAGEEVE